MKHTTHLRGAFLSTTMFALSSFVRENALALSLVVAFAPFVVIAVRAMLDASAKLGLS